MMVHRPTDLVARAAMHACIALLALAIVEAPAGAIEAKASARGGAITSAELDEILSFFYLEPDLDIIEGLLHEISRTGMLREAGTSSPTQGFFAEAFASHPERVDEWANVISELPMADQERLWPAVWLSGSSPGIRRMREQVQSNEELALLKPLLVRAPPPLSGFRPISSGDLDFLWGAFYASGNPAYVQQITSILVLDPEELEANKDVTVTMMRSTVIWSLEVNARSHSLVFEICKRESKTATRARAAALEGIVARVSGTADRK